MKIAHLVETAELGGVMRSLDTLTAHMAGVEHTRYVVSPRMKLPPFVPQSDLVVIHFTASWSKLPFLAALRTMRGRAPIVIVEHSYTAAYETCVIPSRSRFRAMLRLIYSFADRVVAVSHGQGEWLRNAGVMAPEKVVVIPSATWTGGLVDLPPPERRGMAARPLRIGAFGRYHEQKGFGNLIHAMRALPPGLATLKLAGLGPYEERLRALAQGKPEIEVGGPITDIRAFLAACDIVAVPSRWESFGQVALEARAAARPLIASTVDGLIEQVRPGCGWLVAHDNVQGLANAITSAASADLSVMGVAARASAAGHLERSLDLWRGLTRELLDAHAQRSRGERSRPTSAAMPAG